MHFGDCLDPQLAWCKVRALRSAPTGGRVQPRGVDALPTRARCTQQAHMRFWSLGGSLTVSAGQALRAGSLWNAAGSPLGSSRDPSGLTK